MKNIVFTCWFFNCNHWGVRFSQAWTFNISRSGWQAYFKILFNLVILWGSVVPSRTRKLWHSNDCSQLLVFVVLNIKLPCKWLCKIRSLYWLISKQREFIESKYVRDYQFLMTFYFVISRTACKSQWNFQTGMFRLAMI